MSQVSTNNRRIARNTLMLYVRMCFTMVIGFVTTRELLLVLGVVDYGLVNLIGGVVAMFAFLSGTLSGAAARFYNIELGRKDYVRLKQVFNMSQLMYFALILMLFVLIETFGLWVLYNKLNIPDGRFGAAFWFFQFSTITFLLRVVRIPYQALTISHEDMNIYAYVSAAEAGGALLVVYLLRHVEGDLLMLYGVLTALLCVLIYIFYWYVCRRRYQESSYSFYWELALFKEMVSFSGWNLFGAIASVLSGVGVSVLLNNYVGAVANAARGIASQASGGVSSFTQNFLLAVRPQICKYWASGDLNEMQDLVFRASKFGYYLILFVSVPVILEADYILGIWLDNLPEYAITFTQLMIVSAVVDSFSYPIMSAVEATGQIARYQLVVGGLLILKFPLSYFLLDFGYVPQSVFVMIVMISVIGLFARLLLSRRIVGFSISVFLQRVLSPALIVTIVALFLPIFLHFVWEEGILRFICVGFLWVISFVILMLVIGVTAVERAVVFNKVSNVYSLLRKQIANI